VSSFALAKATPVDQGDFGNLCFWHEQGIVLGKCDTHFTEGVCLVESGTWGKDEIAERFREFASKHPDEGAISIRFKTSMDTADRDVVVGGVEVSNIYNDIRIIERSYLPANRASNVFTVFEADGGANVRKEKLELLRRVIGQKAADKIAGTVDVLNEFAATPDAVVKEADEVVGDTVEVAVEPTEQVPDLVIDAKEVVEPVITEPIKEEQETTTEDKETTTEDKEMPTNRVDMPGTSSDSVNSVEAPAEVVLVEEAPLQALRMWAQSLPEAKQKELAPIIIALSGKLEAKDDELEAQQSKIDQQQQAVKPSASNDPTSTPPKQQDPTSKKEEEISEDTVKQDAFEAEMKASLESIAARIDAFAIDLAQLKETTEQQKQEAMPRGVLQRVFSDPSSSLTKEQQETLVVKGQETGPVADMAASVMKTFGGI